MSPLTERQKADLIAERAYQGLSPRVDPAVLSEVHRILDAHRTEHGTGSV